MNKTVKTYRGFTIVELLIVVVVIAILTTISLISYNGIQKRANTASYAATVDGLEKQIRLAMTNGQLTTLDTGGLFICAGMTSDFPATDGLAEGQCSTTGNYLTQPNTPAYANDAMSTQLKDAGVKLPGRMNIASRTGLGSGSGIAARGFMISTNSQVIGIWWYPPDTSSCGRASNETEALINLYKSSPSLTTSMQNAYGADWENILRTGIGGWCSLKIYK